MPSEHITLSTITERFAWNMRIARNRTGLTQRAGSTDGAGSEPDREMGGRQVPASHRGDCAARRGAGDRAWQATSGDQGARRLKATCGRHRSLSMDLKKQRTRRSGSSVNRSHPNGWQRTSGRSHSARRATCLSAVQTTKSLCRRVELRPWGRGLSRESKNAPGRTRTCDFPLDRQVLYPAELRGPTPR